MFLKPTDRLCVRRRNTTQASPSVVSPAHSSEDRKKPTAALTSVFPEVFMSLHTLDRRPDARPGESDALSGHDDGLMDMNAAAIHDRSRPSRRRQAFLRLIRRFNASNDGNIAIMTALLMMPMLGLAGLAIDYASAARSKDRLDQAAMIAATAAANTTRNYLDISGADGAARTNAEFSNNDDDSTNNNAVAEGRRVGLVSFRDQSALVRNVTVATRTATVTRVGNTINAAITYNASQSTLLLGMFRITTLPFSGTGTMIIGLQDTKTNDLTIDERWAAEALSTTYTLPAIVSGALIKDWYAPNGASRVLIGPPPIDDPVLGTTLTTNAATQAKVGVAALTIGSGGWGSLSKKVYLPVGDYELSYWYKSTVTYDAYEPVYICGSEYREWDWATNRSWRNSSGSGSGQRVSAGLVYLDPILTNPQQANNMPTTFVNGNLLDGCAYSARWIQRVVSFRVNYAGYYWLSFVAPVPPDDYHRGFNLGQVKLCAGAGCVGTPYNNSPWKTQPVLLSTDSFETRSNVRDNSNFDLTTPFGYTHPLYKSPVAGWNVRTWSVTTTTNADGSTTDTNNLSPRETWSVTGPTAPIVYRAGPAYAGTNLVEFTQPSKTLSRSLLLTPGVYKQTFQSLSAPRQPNFNCSDRDDKSWFTATYFRTDYPNLQAYGYSAPPAMLTDGTYAERGMFTKQKAYTCNTGISYNLQTRCFLIVRTQFYDVAVLSRDFPGERFDDMRVTLLTSKIADPNQSINPSTWDPRNTSGPQAALAANPDCNGGIVAVIGGIVGWPSYSTFTRGGGRYTVTQSKYP